MAPNDRKHKRIDSMWQSNRVKWCWFARKWDVASRVMWSSYSVV